LKKLAKENHLPALKGTDIDKNILAAFAGENQARKRCLPPPQGTL